MLKKEISDNILTIGCEYVPPKGGIAQVIDTYYKFIYPTRLFIANSTDRRSRLCKLMKCINALIETSLRLLFQNRIKIVHIHTASWNSFYRSTLFIRLAKMMNRKLVVHIHGGGFKEYYASRPEFVRKYLLMADCVIALSESWKDFFINKVRLDNVQVVHNIVPMPQTEFVEKDKMLHALFLGKICQEKGIYDLLQAIELKKEELDGCFMLHIGGNGEKKRLEQFITEHRLQKLVRYEGWVEVQQKPRLLNLCRLYILPSYIEGLPISILEAMSYGEAILSTSVGGIPELVTPNIGCLIQPGHVDSLATQLVRFAYHPELISSMGQNAEKEITPFLPENVMNELNKIYTQLIME